MKNSQLFERMKEKSLELANEIEAATFPGLDGPLAVSVPICIRGLLRDEDTPQSLIDEYLTSLWISIAPHIDEMLGHLPLEIEAAGMVSTSFKKMLRDLFPAFSVGLRDQPIAMKFRSIDRLVLQNPIPMPIPTPVRNDADVRRVMRAARNST